MELLQVIHLNTEKTIRYYIQIIIITTIVSIIIIVAIIIIITTIVRDVNIIMCTVYG